MIRNSKENKVKIIASSFDFTLPDKLHFGALIHEIFK